MYPFRKSLFLYIIFTLLSLSYISAQNTMMQRSNEIYSGNPFQENSAVLDIYANPNNNSAALNIYGNPNSTIQNPYYYRQYSNPWPVYNYYSPYYYPGPAYNYGYYGSPPPPTYNQAFPDDARANALYWSQVQKMQHGR